MTNNLIVELPKNIIHRSYRCISLKILSLSFVVSFRNTPYSMIDFELWRVLELSLGLSVVPRS